MHKATAILVMTALVAAATVPAQAQSDQKIVMHCIYDGNGSPTVDYVIDLAAKTVSITKTIKVGGPPQITTATAALTQVTDEKMNWVYFNLDEGVQTNEALDRYTGRIVTQTTQRNGAPQVKGQMSCQRQQKQL